MSKPTLYSVEDIYEITEDYENRKFIDFDDLKKLCDDFDKESYGTWEIDYPAACIFDWIKEKIE